MGLGEEDRGDKTPFSSDATKGCQLSARLPLLLLASVTWLRCVCQLSPQCSLSFPLSPAVALEGSLCQFTFKESGLMIPFLEGGGCLHNCLGILLYGILIHSSIFTYSVVYINVDINFML